MEGCVVRNKAGRMLMAHELSANCLVVAKLEEKPRLLSAWIRRIEGDEITIKFGHKCYGRKRYETVIGRKNEDGLVLDELGKCIFLWEYINLDGTRYEPERDQEAT
jgi:hypothetical protein